ncbi:type II toxin-antitoxin system VapC family toxin [Spirulina subsalsa]|uniref:type II toxin-antitoxin system VapC family toxin n=1 Tax=Spirulina subsalsa TaxID=54311 RepID=UPI000372C811|nr:type II toxin-antitoxin system VapC family toxin [Spirulina subsalsa]
MYVLDTNIVIYYFKGIGQVKTHLENTLASEIAIPTIVLFELYVGLEKSTEADKRREQLNVLLSRVNVLPFTHQVAKVAANIRAKLEQRGQPIGPFDVLIAGTALTQQATLVTHNTREFQRVEGLLIVDWY